LKTFITFMSSIDIT